MMKSIDKQSIPMFAISRLATVARNYMIHILRGISQAGLTVLLAITRVLAPTFYLKASRYLKVRTELRMILEAKLFDKKWYLKQNAHLSGSTLSLLQHYLEHGATGNYDPHPLFQSAWYLEKNPDVAAVKINPLIHYIKGGFRENRDPHPLFSSSWYIKQNSNYFKNNPINPLSHYLQFGAAEGFSPHPLFDTSWYLKGKYESEKLKITPLEHFLTVGVIENQSPHILFDLCWYRSTYLKDMPSTINPLEYYLTRGAAEGHEPNYLFDTPSYLAQIQGIKTNINALVHYVELGAVRGLNPHPLFETRWYLQSNPVGNSMLPLEHYFQVGAALGYTIHPLFDNNWYITQDVSASLTLKDSLKHYITHGREAGWNPNPVFDNHWYLERNPDIAIAKLQPMLHYYHSGAAEGRDPHPLFDTDWYLMQNTDARDLGNALAHYLHIGAAKGYSPHPLFESKWYIHKYPEIGDGLSHPLLHYLKVGALAGYNPSPNFDNEWYLDTYPDVAKAGFNPLIHYSYLGIYEGRDPSPPATRHDYGLWVREYDTLTVRKAAVLQDRLKKMTARPLVSVLIDSNMLNLEALGRIFQSISKQLYKNFDLYIIATASNAAAIQQLSSQEKIEREHVKLLIKDETCDQVDRLNAALDIIQGDYFVDLTHNGILSESSLFWIAENINSHNDAAILYTDEDKICKEGRRSEPHFKSSWNLELFYSHNILRHFAVFHTKTIRKIGGFRSHVAAHNYDLTLRCLEHIEPQQIVHISKVLYHKIQASEENLHDVSLSELQVLNEHFSRQKLSYQAETLSDGKYRVQCLPPHNNPQVSIIILTRNGLNFLKKCVESILEKTQYPNYDILIVDNGSDDQQTLDYLSFIQTNNRIRVVRDPQPFNFSALNNAAVEFATGEFVCLLNNDIEVISPGWLNEMVGLASQEGAGAVGARLWFPNDTLQHGGILLGIMGVAGHAHMFVKPENSGYMGRAHLPQVMSAVTAACLVIRKSIYEKVQGLDAINLKVAFNDVDFCLRVREAGYRNIWTPHAELFHYESATRGYDTTEEKKAFFKKEFNYMKRRWGAALFNDPFYNPNMTLIHADFSLAWPPRNDLLYG